MTKELIKLVVNNKSYEVNKLHGDGFCTCAACREEKGWSWEWTDFCYEYKDKIYCSDCIRKVLANENNYI